MRIGFDAKRAFMNSSGLGNYSRTLILSLIENFPEHEYVAFTSGMKENLGKELIDSGNLKIVMPPRFMQGFLSSLWRSYGISESIRSLQLDVFHGLSNELPKRIPFSTKKIVTIHDLIFLRHPEWYAFIDRNIYYKKFRQACKQADAVVAVSEQTKKDVLYYFNIPEDKVKVIYQSCNGLFFQQKEESRLEEFRKKANLPQKYILYVGTIEERKNLLAVVKALLKVNDCSLVVIGKRKKYFEKVAAFISAHRLESRIIFLPGIQADELPLYYQAASAFVYPSLYEGFGIPVIEALRCGVPVITSGTTALPEAGGPSSLYIDPLDSDDLAGKLNRVLGDGELRAKMIGEGLQYSGRFQDDVTSAQVMDLYKS